MTVSAASTRKLIGSLTPRLEPADPHTPGGVLVGLVGRGIGRSRSPQMHEREGRRLGLSYSYLLIDFDELNLGDDALGAVLDAAVALGFAGLNVTHPFKQQVMAHIHDLAPEAAAIGAVNTVVLKDGRRVGHNTDAWGFAENFRSGLPEAPLEGIVQFGAGGGGAAVGYAVLQLGAERLSIVDVDIARAERLSNRLSQRFGPRVAIASDPIVAILDSTGAINTTPVGMDKYPGTPFPPDRLTSSQWVADIVYFPPETELLKRARAIGCRTLSGTGMAVFQAIKAFELFTGLTPDRGAMVEHFEAAA